MSDELDITDSLAWEDGLPSPKWDHIAAWVEARGDPDAPRDAWTQVARQWLTALGPALNGRYAVSETEHFLGVAPTGEGIGPSLLGFAERCRASLLSLLGGVTDFLVPGKQVVVVLGSDDDYYRYISGFTRRGSTGSAGVHPRGYPHVAVRGTFGGRETVLATS